MSERQREVCASRLSPPRREEFLGLLEEAQNLAKRAWAIYYADTGLKPRIGRPKVKPDPIPKHIPTNEELFLKFQAWCCDMKFQLNFLDAADKRSKVFGPLKVSRDRVRALFAWAKREHHLLPTGGSSSKYSHHTLWRIKG